MRKLRRISVRGIGRLRDEIATWYGSPRLVTILIGVAVTCAAAGAGIALASGPAARATRNARPSSRTTPGGTHVKPSRAATRAGVLGIPKNAKLLPSRSTPSSRTYVSPNGVYTTVIYGQVTNPQHPRTTASLLPPGPPPPVGGGSGTAKQDCTLASNSPTTSLCPATTDKVGYDGTNTDNTVVQFNTENIPKENVLNAQVGMYLSSASTSNAVSVSAYAIPSGRAWTESATWETYDGTHAWTKAGGDFSEVHAYATTVSTTVGWKYWYPTQTVQEWAAGTLANDGLLLADTTQKSTVDMLSFNSSKAASNQPFMTVSWTKRGQWDDSRYSMQRFRIDDRSNMAVNLGSGNLFIGSNDLFVKGTGLPFHAEHDYNSLNREIRQLNPWYGNVPVTELYADGSIAFSLPHYDWLVFIKQPNGSFLTPPGINATLCTINGTSCTKNSGDPSEATYALTFNTDGNGPWYKAGTKWTWGSTTGLLSIADRYSNKLVYHFGGSENGFTDTQGRAFKRHTTEVGEHTYTTAWNEEPSGREVKYEYNVKNQLITYTDALGHKTKYGYDEDEELHEITDPNGKVTTFNYDESNRVTKITQPEVAGKHPVWEYGYFAATDTEHGHTCETGGSSPQNTATQKTVVTDPDKNKSTFCSNEENLVLQSYDAAGNKTLAAYNELSDRTSTTAAAPGTGEKGNIASTVYETPEAGHDRVQCAITGVSEVRSSCPTGESGSALVTAFTYKDKKNEYMPYKATDPQGNNTFRCYNGEAIEENKGKHEPGCSGSSGPSGSLQSVGDELPTGENELKFEYNSNGTVKSSTDADKHTTSYEYDEHGNLTKIKPPSGSGLKETTISVDGDGRPHVVTDGAGHISTIAYDKLDRITEIAYTGTGTAKTVKFEYDSNGNLIKREDSTGTTKYTVDALGRLTKEALPGSQSNEYGYDPASNLTSFTDSGGTTKYEYNELNELKAMFEPGGSCSGTPSKCTKFAYDNDHRLKEIAYPSGAKEKYELEEATGRPKTITFEGLSGTSVPNLTYAYKKGTNQTSLVQSLSESGSGAKTEYSYDALNRLKETVTKNAHQERYLFVLDGAGNRTREQVNLSGESGGTFSYFAYNAGNELECRQTVEPPCSGSSTTELSHYSYDEAGEVTAITPKHDTSGATFAYNAASELKSLTPSGESEKALTYGGSGQDDLVTLGSATLQNSTLGLTKEVAAGGTSYFARSPGGLMVDERTPSGNFNPLYDAQGDVIALVNSSGKVERTFRYGPYGENVHSEGIQTIPYPFGYKSGYRMPGGNKGETSVENGLYHFGQRYYDPTSGRWTQRALDGFQFTADSPGNLSDPGGEEVQITGRQEECLERVGRSEAETCGVSRSEEWRGNFWSWIEVASEIYGILECIYRRGNCPDFGAGPHG